MSSVNGAPHSLFDRFTISKGSGDRRPRLRDKIIFPCNRLRYDATVVLVTPDNEVHAVIEHAFRDRLLGPMSHAVTRRE